MYRVGKSFTNLFDYNKMRYDECGFWINGGASQCGNGKNTMLRGAMLFVASC